MLKLGLKQNCSLLFGIALSEFFDEPHFFNVSYRSFNGKNNFFYLNDLNPEDVC